MNRRGTDIQTPLVESVLHPTDFSSASETAFVHALAIALIRQTQFTILHVMRGRKSEVDWRSFPRVRETMERWGLLEPGSERSAVFDKFRVRVTKQVVHGRHTGLATAKFLEQRPHDLIVLATDGLEGPSRWINRSDAESIANWARTMTLFVPAGIERGLVSVQDGELNLKNILVPVDSEPDCEAALEFAKRAAVILGNGDVTITVLHVGDAEFVIPLLSKEPGWTWQTDLRQGKAVDEIVAAADRYRSDLIVMATAGHDSVLDALRGTTTEQVLRRAPCPVLAVPAR